MTHQTNETRDTHDRTLVPTVDPARSPTRDGPPRSAVVLGGSMAGLLAAHVLAGRGVDVVLVDRDDLGADPGLRRGTPQARHAHALLARGGAALESLFPGLTEELRRGGAPIGDMPGDVRFHVNGRPLARSRTGMLVVSTTRTRLERAVRSRVLSHENVALVAPADAVGLVVEQRRGRRDVVGARVLARADGSPAETIEADLVVDALGRGSPVPRWLADTGLEIPAERVEIGLSYASRLYRLPGDALGGDLASFYAPSPAHPRGGVLARVGPQEWMLTLCGVLGDRPPTDDAGLLAFARSLPGRDVADAVAGAEATSEAVAFRFPAGTRHRVDTVRDWPDGLVPVGDTVASFNPVYGQGMTVAALEALELDRALDRAARRRSPVGSRQVVRSVARQAGLAWEMAAGADLEFPGASGARTRGRRVAARYLRRVQAAATSDPVVAATFARVSGLVAPPAALVRPTTVARVLRAGERSGPRARLHQA